MDSIGTEDSQVVANNIEDEGMLQEAHRPLDVREGWRDWLSDILGVVAVLVLIGFLFSGCGGGTSGTGISGSGALIEGRVRDETGMGVAGVIVTIPELAAQTVTDAGGEFSVETAENVDDLTVTLSGQGVDSTVPVNDIPDETSSIDVSVTVDSNSGVVSDTSVNIVTTEVPEPTLSGPLPFEPTPTPSPAPSPTSEPIPVVTIPSPGA